MPNTLSGGDDALMRIGDVAEHAGLSLRTIRYYEEAGLVTPSTRTVGGFRLYSAEDTERLRLVTRMKPLGFSLDEMRELLQLLDEDEDAADVSSQGTSCERLAHFAEMVDERCRRLEDQLSAAGEFADMLRERSGRSVGAGRDGSRAG